MDQTVAILHPIDYICGLPCLWIKILQPYIEAPLRRRCIGADASHRECLTMRITHPQMVHQHPQRQAFDINNLGVLGRGVHPGCVEIT